MDLVKFTLVLGCFFALSYVEGAAPATGEWSFNTVTCNFRMSFGARLKIPYTDVDGKTQIKEQDLPTGATISDSICTDNKVTVSLRYFLGTSDPDTYHWAYELEFTKGNDNDYMLKRVTVQYFLDTTRFANINPSDAGKVVRESTESVQPKAKLGTYLGTEEVNFEVGQSKIGVLMTNVKLQPFASSVTGGGYGTETPFTYTPNASNLVASPSLCLLTSLAMFCLLILRR